MLASRIIGSFGMVNGLVSWEVVRSFTNPDPVSAMVGNTETREQIAQILKECKDSCTELLRAKGRHVEAIRDRLLEKEELYGDEIDAIMAQVDGEESGSQQGELPVAEGAIAGGSEPQLPQESADGEASAPAV
jgi:ATP-dependent Zn protease